jgi:hypothetical protein
MADRKAGEFINDGDQRGRGRERRDGGVAGESRQRAPPPPSATQP